MKTLLANASDACDCGAVMKMNQKPVFEVPAKTVLNLNSGFVHKKLCDGLTFTAGTSCCYSCSYCYVEDAVAKTSHFQDVLAVNPGVRFGDIVMRRKDAVELLSKQLTYKKNGKPKFRNPNDNRVVYASPLVDVAANITLADETVEMTTVILELTNWQIRLLSKSTLLPRIAAKIAERNESWKQRVIFGVSTGTLDDQMARAIEKGTPLVSKRIESLHWLQDHGFRTFGMVCPSLPQVDGAYSAFARRMSEVLRTDQMEAVWAEALNARGESFEQTHAALVEHGFQETADEFKRVTTDKAAWEKYSRDLFEAHPDVYHGQMATDSAGGPKLRFLQYVTKATRAEYWTEQVPSGAVLL